jgi:hypothetical protein
MLANILENVVEHFRTLVLREEPFAFQLSKKMLHREHHAESAAVAVIKPVHQPSRRMENAVAASLPISVLVLLFRVADNEFREIVGD